MKAAVAGAGALAAPALIGRVQAAGVLRIGHPAPLTGPSGSFGIRVRDGSFMAMNEINGAGGLVDGKGNQYKVEIVAEDYGNDPKQAVTLFRRFAQDSSVSAVIGPISSTGWVPCVPVAAQMQMPLIGNGSLANIKEWNTWSYRVNPVSRFTVPAMLAKIVQAAKIKRLAVIYDQSNDGQVATANSAKEVSSKLGYEVVATEAYRTGEQDFSVYIAKVRAAKADGVLLASQTGDGVRISPQIKSAGLDIVQITGEGNFLDPVWWDGAKGTIQGGYTYLHTDMNPKTGRLRQWLDTYNKKHEITATTHSIDGYTSALVVVEAVKRANSTDRKKIHDVLQGMEFTSPLGNKVVWKNPPHGDNLTPSITVVRVTGRGTYEVVG